MIKFFRKIRQQLLSENPPAGRAGKFSKYLVYAFGEIILVVIGILIALQINTNSQEKTNRQHVESILKSVYVNFESDMADPVIRYMGFFESKDSLNMLVLNKDLSYEDYAIMGFDSRGLIRLLNYEIEPFQFEDQAYERLMANIEIIPEDYMPIVKMLQDVYSKEVPVVNEVVLEVKAFVDEIEDKYQARYDWYSNTDSSHFRQRVNYMLNSPKYLNDVKRHQELINHLLQHLMAIKLKISIAYSKIHTQLLFKEPFSAIIDQFYFPTESELKEYTGTYKRDENTITFNSKEYYLTPGNSGFKLIKVNKDKFIASSDPKYTYMQFVRNEEGMISAFNLYRINEKNDTLVRLFDKIE